MRRVKRAFDKMHGLGNDFVVLDAREAPLDLDAQQVQALGDRRTGIGFDQLIVLRPSDQADLRIDIWNADGSPAEACGNASRCVVALTGATTIDTDGGVIEGKTAGAAVEVSLGEPRFEWDSIPLAYPTDTAPLPMAWDPLERPDAVNVGNPHLCFFVDDIGAIPLEKLGPRIESDPAFRGKSDVFEISHFHLHFRDGEAVLQLRKLLLVERKRRVAVFKEVIDLREVERGALEPSADGYLSDLHAFNYTCPIDCRA